MDNNGVGTAAGFFPKGDKTVCMLDGVFGGVLFSGNGDRPVFSPALFHPDAPGICTDSRNGGCLVATGPGVRGDEKCFGNIAGHFVRHRLLVGRFLSKPDFLSIVTGPSLPEPL